jgi:hypothetical protein
MISSGEASANRRELLNALVLLLGLPLLAVLGLLWWWAPWAPALAGARERAQLVALTGNETLLDSLARSMTDEGWRRLRVADCTVADCQLQSWSPYATAADFDGDGHIDLVLGLTDDRMDHAVWYHGTAEGFEGPRLLFSVDSPALRRGGFRIAPGPALEIWDWERQRRWNRFRWDPLRQILGPAT